MKKTITPSRNFFIRFIYRAASLLLFIGISQVTYSQCSMNCNISGSVALDENCFAEITPDDILEGTPNPACGPFTVVVDATGGNFVTNAQLGQTVSVTVTNGIGNSCSGSLMVYDEWNPTIQCQPATITCFDDPSNVAAPTATDNCDPAPNLTFTESIQDIGCGGQAFYKIITRTYTATDASGNSSSCDQIINVTRPMLTQVAFPQNLDDLQLPSLDCINPNTAPSNTGVPTINGNPINTTCDFAADYVDQQIAVCQNSYKILREWTVYDWCSSQNTSMTQVIKVADKTAPIVTCPPAMTISTQQNDCFASMGLPIPTISDNCSSLNNISTTVTASAGTIVGNAIFNLPIGQHTITYSATDDCGNTGSCTLNITVEDQIAPVAVCESFHVVALNSPGAATLVQAVVFDDGSEDNCSDVTFLARRMDAAHCPGPDGTGFEAFVPFYCCDIGNTVMVELQVRDAAGNINSCMVEATVQDELNPFISCPAPITLDCNANVTDLSVTGEPIVTDNCNATASYFDNGGTDNCGGGTINRIWTAVDGSGNTSSCVQTITLQNSTPYYIADTECNNADPNDGVIWPCDFDSNACGPALDPSATGEPQIFEDFCDLVAVTYADTYLPITADACVKVLREWLIVDWCQYDEDNPTAGGSWTYVQIIKVLNSADPVITSDCDDMEFCSFDENCAVGPATLTVTATDDCSAIADLNYSYEIDAFNDGTIEMVGYTSDASGDYPIGTHKITWEVEDGCGNIVTCDYLFTIKDCKKPTPYAYNGLAIELMPVQQMVELWAIDFDAGSFDNCDIAEFRIASPSGGPGQTTPPPFPSTSVTFDCDDVGTNTVDLWVRDVNDNWDYVSTYVIVQDNNVSCNGASQTIMVSGTIETEEAIPANNVLVYESLGGPGLPNSSVYTNGAGTYNFEVDTDLATNLTLEPYKNEDPLNGVTTYDLVLASQHILNINLLDSPYKMIAADINRSGTITTLDLVALRKVILFIDTEFSDNTSWRFVDASFVFPNVDNPFATSFPEIYSINGLEGDIVADFVAIKVGDLNGSAFFNGEGGEQRNASTMPLKAAEQNLVAGEAFTTYLRSADLAQLLGYQFTLQFDTEALEFVGIEDAALTLSEQNFGFQRLDHGYITTSWNENQAVNLKAEDALFGITFRAKTNTALSQVLAIGSKLTKAEAYNAELQVMDLALTFDGTQTAVNLAQNRPNPFIQETTIDFELTEAGKASLNIIDLTGKSVALFQGDFSTGLNQFIVTQSDLPNAGVYYYELTTANQKITKKMVHLRSKE